MIELTKSPVIKVILAPLLCFISLYFLKIEFEYYPISFALIISIINYKKYRLNPITGTILNIICSFFIFFGGYVLSLFLMSALKDFFGEDLSGFIGILIGANIFAPVVVFTFYNKIFIFPRSKFNNIIIIISIILLILSLFYLYYYADNENFKVNFYILWQIIISLSLQIILCQKDLMKSIYAG